MIQIKLRRNYSKEPERSRMEAAYNEATSQESPNIKAVSEKFNVSRKALEDRVSGKTKLYGSPGKKPLLTQDEEDYLSGYLMEMAALGFGYDNQAIKKLITTLLGKDARDLTAGWVQYFLQKHPEICRRRAEALNKLTVRAFNVDLIEYYFLNLEVAIFKCEELSNNIPLSPNRIYCMDETGFSPSAGSSYVIAKKGARQVYSVVSDRREHLTLVAHASANGQAGSPMFIIPKKVQNFLGSHFPGASVCASAKGYMDSGLFIEWCTHFVNDIKAIRGDPDLWCLLVLDSLGSHTMVPEALRVLNENNILAISLPSHTSSFLQMHDVAIFSPLKKYFKASISSFLREKQAQIKIEDLPAILEEPYALANNSLNIKRGFAKVGIYPLNRHWISENQSLIKFLSIESKTSAFDELSKTRKINKEMPQLLKSLEYLELATQEKYFEGVIQAGKPSLVKSLSGVLNDAKTKVRSIQSPTHKLRKNMLGEFYDDSKILNEEERIVKLTEELAKRAKVKQEKEERKIQKMLMNAQQSQESSQKSTTKKRKSEKAMKTLIEEHNASSENSIQEIVYKKSKPDSNSQSQEEYFFY